MQDRFFIDTNLLIYYVSNDASRKTAVKDLLVDNENIIISSQVITEFVATTVKKKILSFDDSVKYAKEFMDLFYLGLIDKEAILLSFKITKQYKYSIWDSLIIASALESNCSVLYTEDMQDGRIIDGSCCIMSRLTAISYNDLIRKLKMFGFYGPFSGGKHMNNSKVSFYNRKRRHSALGYCSPVCFELEAMAA